MGVALGQVIFSLGFVLLTLSVLTLFFISADAPEFTPAILSAIVNLITVVGAGIYLLKQVAKKR